MSEPIVEQPTPAQGDAEIQPTEPATEAPATPEVDWKAKAREWERRAKENKAAADKLAELEESQKTEQQKLAERLADAERKAAEAELKAARAEVAREKGVPAELLVGSTAEELADYADKLLTFRGEAPKKPAAPPSDGQGNVGSVIGAKQLTRSDLKNMSPQQIEAARIAGELNDLMSGRAS